MEMQVLRVDHHSEDPTEEKRITLSPSNIVLVAASMEDTTVKGRSLRAVTVLFADGASIDLCVDHSDLLKIESAVGGYFLGI